MHYREGVDDPAMTFDGGYHLYAKEKHKERVSKNPERTAYAEEQLKSNGIEYVIKNKSIGHFHCRRKSNDELVQFWAGTGKILGRTDIRGIHALIQYLLS